MVDFGSSRYDGELLHAPADVGGFGLGAPERAQTCGFRLDGEAQLGHGDGLGQRADVAPIDFEAGTAWLGDEDTDALAGNQHALRAQSDDRFADDGAADAVDLAELGLRRDAVAGLELLAPDHLFQLSRDDGREGGPLAGARPRFCLTLAHVRSLEVYGRCRQSHLASRRVYGSCMIS